ncbi:GAP1-N2 domain-containing protein [Neobacillus sp. Marseille-QA0830]
MSGKIQQQLYTRERGGIFSTTDGYDTIAISEGLQPSFVKKYLHPFCIYQAPKALTTRGEKDASAYPEAVTLFQPETGDLVIGQAVFVPADFTGERSAYFMHNYIIPDARKEEWIKQPEKLFQLNDYQTSYNMDQGKTLPELVTVSYGTEDVLAKKEELMAELGINDDDFKQLLFAVLTSVSGKKKVFISLNVPLQDYSKASLKLLELLYLYLPYAHRRKLGAMTFTSDPEGKNYIHVMFYEPGTLNTADRSIEKQFIFDFANGRISGVDITGQKHEYLDFAIERFSQYKRMDDFFEFAETALSGLPEEQKLQLSSYYHLTDLYLTLNGSDASIYPKNKVGFLNGLVNFLQTNSDEKLPLVKLFVKILTEEKYVRDSSIALDYIRAVVSVNKIVRSDEALSFVLDTLENFQSDPLFFKLWKIIEQDKFTNEVIINFISEHIFYEDLLKKYLEEQFKQGASIKDILNQVKLLLGLPILLNVEMFHSLSISKVYTSIQNERQAFDGVLTVNDFSLNIINPKFASLKAEMVKAAKLALLGSMKINKLSIDDILKFGKIFPNDVKVKDEQSMRNYTVTITLHKLLSNPSQAAFVSLNPLGRIDRELLRETLKQLLTKVAPEHFPVLIMAYSSDTGEVDYRGIFKHLVQFSDEKTFVAFIRMHTNWLVNKQYKLELRSYLIKHPQSIWKDKTCRNALKEIPNGSLKKLLKEVETETASPIMKFFKKNGVKLLLSLLAVGVAGGGAWFGVDYFSGKNDKQAAVKTSNPKVEEKESKKEEEIKDSPILLEQFKESTEQNQMYQINLEGPQFKRISMQVQGVTLTNNDNGNFQLDVATDTGTSPFEKGWKLKKEFSLKGIENDFDIDDQNKEVVLVAKDETGETFLWIYSVNLKDAIETTETLTPIYRVHEEGVTNISLDGKQLVLIKGEKEEPTLYPFTSQSNLSNK